MIADRAGSVSFPGPISRSFFSPPARRFRCWGITPRPRFLGCSGTHVGSGGFTSVKEKEFTYGSQIFQIRLARRRARDAQEEARHVEKRQDRQESNEPQAGDCHRTFRSPQKGQEGSEEESELAALRSRHALCEIKW